MKKTILSIATSTLLAMECGGVDTLFPFEEIVQSGVESNIFDINQSIKTTINGNLEIGNGKVNSALKFDGKSYLSN